MAGKIELAEAIVPIVPSARGIKGNIEKELSGEMTSAGKSGGELFGKELVGKLKAVIAAAGIGKILQSAMSEGAKLQQSYGGLETIYGDAAESAKKYAVEAAKAGISANDYAEQAVSFGASLKQAFAGDTTAAMEAANTAILDMTDNAAKMGTPIENIQNAYQGFAKQNYTMLDNLKLGYGGTKTEMERLLADAEKLTGVKYDINSLGDVYEAIHVIQGELGLTGVAAAEASGTFSGSMGAMQAALHNFLGAMALGEDVRPALEVLIGNAGVFISNNLIPMLTQIISSIPTVITTAAPLLLQAVQALMTSVIEMLGVQSLSAGMSSVTQLAGGFLSGLPEMITTAGTLIGGFIDTIGAEAPGFITKAGEMMTEFVGTILQNLPSILDSGAQVVSNLADGAVKAIPGIVAAAASAIANFLQTVLSNLPQIVDSGINLVTSWAEGMNKNTSALIYAVANGIKQILSTIVQNLPQILESGIKIIATLLSGIVRQVPNVITTIAALIADIVKSFVSYDWGSLGTRILEGIAKGLTSGAHIIADAAKNAAKNAFEAAKNFLGIESPSKLFRDQVGAMMAEGMAIGFEDNVPTAEIESALQPIANVVPDAMGGTQYSYGGFAINVYGAPGQNVQELADIVADRINQAITSRQAVFA